VGRPEEDRPEDHPAEGLAAALEEVPMLEVELGLAALAHKVRPRTVKEHTAMELRIVSVAVRPAVAVACPLGEQMEPCREQEHIG
jgi:hypothetical protein